MEIKTITDRITCIVATLPNNPLKSLNAYIVRGDRRNMLIDTGFHLDETFSDLKEGIRELGVDMARTDIFLTHCHADHTGNAGRIASESSTIYASAIDKELIDSFISDNEGLKQYMTGQMSRLGFPESKNASSLSKNPSVKNNEPDVFAISAVEESHIFDLGGVRLRCIYTPGHTPGHMCLYIDEDKTLFTGDHILFDITPNITEWSIMDDALGTYLDSLAKVRKMDVLLALPSHRESGELRGRIDSLIAHHEARLEEALRIVAGTPAQTCYEVASQMQWKVSAGNWEAFPLSQLYFAVGEALSHLRHLEKRGLIRIESVDGVYRNFAV